MMMESIRQKKYARTMKNFTFTTYLDESNAVGYTCITVPKEIVEAIGGFGTRVMCSINGNEKIHSGIMGKGDGDGYIIINKTNQKKWGIGANVELQAALEPDTSKYGMKVPEELEALLEQDREGAEAFEAITPGRQRFIINHVDGVKSSQKRIDRAITMIENLKTMPEGPFSHRHLLGLPPKEEE